MQANGLHSSHAGIEHMKPHILSRLRSHQNNMGANQADCKWP